MRYEAHLNKQLAGALGLLKSLQQDRLRKSDPGAPALGARRAAPGLSRRRAARGARPGRARPPPRRERRPAGRRGPRAGPSASCGRGPTGAGSSHGSRGRGPAAPRASARARRSRRGRPRAPPRRRRAASRTPGGGARRPGSPPRCRTALLNGVRPNSVAHATGTSSNSPARLRSRMRPAIGRSACRASRPRSAMSPCESRWPGESVRISSTNRAPRSTRRRATRHCQPKPSVWPRLRPYRASVSSVSFERSSASGTSVHIPNSVSNDSIRAASAGRPAGARGVVR